MKVIFLLLLVASTLCSCSNRRFYFGVDDYGEPERFEHTFKTRGHDDGARRSNGDKY